MPEATAIADNALALEFEIDLSKPGRSRLLRRLGKRTGGGATDKREFGNSVRDSATGLRGAEQSGNRGRGGFGLGDGEKAFARRFPQTRSHQPQPTHGADAMNHLAIAVAAAVSAAFAGSILKLGSQTDRWPFGQ